jgi:hypothetical protein
MRDAQMPAKHLRVKPALEANDVIPLHRVLDRNRRLRRLLDASETGERAMDLEDQSCELIGLNLVMPHVASDDVRDLIEVNL